MKFSELVRELGEAASQNSLVAGSSTDPNLNGAAALDRAGSNQLSFIEGQKFADRVATTAASALILPADETLESQANQRAIAWIATPQPRLLFARAIALFYQPFRPEPGIHPSAIVHPSATIGRDVYIGARAVIEAGVTLGDGVCIFPNAVIYPEVEIGDRSVLHANCTIHERTRIGADCTIHSGAVVGGEGFGFVPSSQGWFKMEQSGYTVLEDGVEIGSNTTIDRPAVGETRVGANTKIDNLVQIGHGCEIGSNCALAAQVGLAGGVKLGNNVILAGQVGVANQSKVGDGAIASAKTGIHQDVDPGAVVSGFPAIPNKLWLKSSAIYKRLPEFYQALRQIQRHFNSASQSRSLDR